MTDTATPQFDNNEQAIEHIMGILDAEDAPEKEEKAAAPQAPSGETEEKEEEDKPETAIEPPHSWTNELKAKWASIPEDVQREIAQHEAERQSKLGKKLEESAATTKAAKAAEERAEQERQRFAQLSEYFATQANTIDPLLAEAHKIDWTKLAQENPAEYVSKRAQLEQRVQQLQTVEAERQRYAEDQQRQLIQKGTEVLNHAIPEWRDEGKRTALQNELVEVAKTYGYTPEEYGNILDHRNIIVLRDLRDFQAMKAAQASLPEKKVAPAAPRVARPGGGDTPKTQSGQEKALRARFNSTRKESDALALMNAILGD